MKITALFVAFVAVLGSCKQRSDLSHVAESQNFSDAITYSSKHASGEMFDGLSSSISTPPSEPTRQGTNPLPVQSCRLKRTTFEMHRNQDSILAIINAFNVSGDVRTSKADVFEFLEADLQKLLGSGSLVLTPATDKTYTYSFKDKTLTRSVLGPLLTGITVPGFQTKGRIRRITSIEFASRPKDRDSFLSTPIVGISLQEYEQLTGWFKESPEERKTHFDCTDFVKD